MGHRIPSININKEILIKLSKKKGRLFIVSGPSGTGKTTLCKTICKIVPKLVYSISYTTRSPRRGEKKNTDYYFTSESSFKSKICKGEWLEWAKVYNNFYGTPLNSIQQNIKLKLDVLLDIDVKGTLKILKKYPKAITIFIVPGSIIDLKKRLIRRGTEKTKNIINRLLKSKLELEKKKIYKYIIYNNSLNKAINELLNVVK